MELVAIYLVAALVGGMVARTIHLPPMVGFLASGFALNASGVADLPGLEVLADFGVIMLLFTIGLKMDVRTLAERHVWATTVLHLVLFGALIIGALGVLAVAIPAYLGDKSMDALITVGLAAAFSSTVVAVTMLDERGDETSLYGRAAIGVLLMQDAAAVVLLGVTEGKAPSPWAVTLVLAWPVARLIRWGWARLGHGDIEVLFGVVVAIVPGYFAFSALGIEGDVGALVMGLLLSRDPHAASLAARLVSVKDLFLVGFFVSIGFTGLPTAEMLVVAVLLVMLLPLKAALFALLFRWGRLRNRTSVLAGITLGTYSEFGIIVTALAEENRIVDDEWVVTMALAVALSFVAAALVNRHAPAIAMWVSRRAPTRPEYRLHPEDRHIDAGPSEVVILGMGRVGLAAYEHLSQRYRMRVLGIDKDRLRVEALTLRGIKVVEGDAADNEFWDRVRHTGRVRMVLLAMSVPGENITALEQLERSEFSGLIAVMTRDEEEGDGVRRAGADVVVELYDGAGIDLADEAMTEYASREYSNDE